MFLGSTADEGIEIQKQPEHGTESIKLKKLTYIKAI